MWHINGLKELHNFYGGWWLMHGGIRYNWQWKVVTKLEEYLCELLFSLTQLSELNSFVLVVTKDALVKDECINYLINSQVVSYLQLNKYNS